MTSRNPQRRGSSSIRKRYLDVKRSVSAAGNAPVSDPAGRALVLRVAGPVAAVTALATGALFHMYEAAKAQAAFIGAHDLPIAPPHPAWALAGGILGAAVTVLFAGTMVEVATGKRLIDLPRLAAARLSALARSGRAPREVAVVSEAAAASAAPAPSGRESIARRLLPARTA